MAKNKRDLIADLSENLCSRLTDLGFEFHWEADNRHHNRSRYIFVRRPVPLKIRVSDHPSPRIEKEKENSRVKVFDVGPHALSTNEVLNEISNLVARSGCHGPSSLAVMGGN